MGEHPDPTAVVADIDVIGADLFVGGDAREALDLVRNHDWMTWVLTPELREQAMAVIATLSDPDLAEDWGKRIDKDGTLVEPPGDIGGHPALVAAAAGGAASVLTYDGTLQGANTGLAIRQHVATSVKSPAAFVSQVDPAALRAAGSDRDDPAT